MKIFEDRLKIRNKLSFFLVTKISSYNTKPVYLAYIFVRIVATPYIGGQLYHLLSFNKHVASNFD